MVLRDRADDRADHHDRGVGMAVADRVEQTVDGGHEGPLAHRVGVDDVDPELQADQIGREVTDRAGRELVELALPGEAEAVQVDTRGSRRHGGPRPGRVLGLHAVADRTAVVHPPRPARRRRRLDRCAVVETEFAQHRRGILREPHLDVLAAGGESVEADHARIGVHHLEVERGAVGKADHVGHGERLAAHQLAVDDEIDRRGVRGDAAVLEPGEHRLQLDRGGVGDELEPAARRHRRHEPDRRIDQLGTGPRGEPLGQRAPLHRRQVDDPRQADPRVGGTEVDRPHAPGRDLPGATVRARMPSVARRLASEMIGNRSANPAYCSCRFDQS